LTNITLPGSGGALHYGPGHHDGNGPIFVYTWDDNTNTFYDAQYQSIDFFVTTKPVNCGRDGKDDPSWSTPG
jgi:hypothetical protein